MEGNEQLSPQIALDSESNRQESLQRQLDQLDNTQPSDRVLGKFLSELYQPENYQMVDNAYNKPDNIRYEPKCALINYLTDSDIPTFRIYEYKPIVEAVKNIPDYFNIFPEIQNIFRQSKGKENQQIIREIACLITEKTKIPIVFSQSLDDRSELDNWVTLENGDVCHIDISDNLFGLRRHTYHGSPKIYSDLTTQGYSNDMDYTPTGEVIILNEKRIDEPQAIQTAMHELGHIAENRFILPQKEEEFKDKPVTATEVISSLYGLKAGLMMAEQDEDLSFKIIQNSVFVYNWILAGTVAP